MKDRAAAIARRLDTRKVVAAITDRAAAAVHATRLGACEVVAVIDDHVVVTAVDDLVAVVALETVDGRAVGVTARNGRRIKPPRSAAKLGETRGLLAALGMMRRDSLPVLATVNCMPVRRRHQSLGLRRSQFQTMCASNHKTLLQTCLFKSRAYTGWGNMWGTLGST